LASAYRKTARRKKFARVRDSRLRNKHTIKRTDKKRFHLWFEHPGRYDLQGVDTPRRRVRIRKRQVVRWAKKRAGMTTKTDNQFFARFTRKRRRVNRPMNPGLQLFRLKSLAARHGVAGDVLDLRSMVDSRLHYRENRGRILPKIRILSSDPHEVETHKRRLTPWHESGGEIF
jgi:hypothetical protein